MSFLDIEYLDKTITSYKRALLTAHEITGSETTGEKEIEIANALVLSMRLKGIEESFDNINRAIEGLNK